ncbi:MAG: low-density lipoprotein receptor class A repeat-containing protein [Candidatus Poseidoniaceae archaeon]
MKKIALLLALSMMLAGCTELEELVDTLDETYTTQDLDGTYHGMLFSMRVAMNADDSYNLYMIIIMYCQETANEAQTDVVDMNDGADESSSTTYVVIDEVCVAEETHIDSDPGMNYIGTLDSSSNVPTLSIQLSESTGYFVCDNGDELDAEWVGDGYDDCANGEDEAEGAEDAIQTDSEIVANAYLAADGYGVIALLGETMEDGTSICLALSPTGMHDLTLEAAELLEAAENDGAEIDFEDESTIPTEVVTLFAVHELAYALSPISTMAEGCEGQSFLFSALLSYIWATSLAGPDEGDDGGFSMYGFAVNDASGSPTTAGGEDLVYVAMDAGEDLNWASVIVQMSVDGGAYLECTNPDQATDTGCAVSDNDDGIWAFGEEVTISEGSDDLCSGPCGVQIKIFNAVEQKLIYESTTTNVA